MKEPTSELSLEDFMLLVRNELWKICLNRVIKVLNEFPGYRIYIKDKAEMASELQEWWLSGNYKKISTEYSREEQRGYVFIKSRYVLIDKINKIIKDKDKESQYVQENNCDEEYHENPFDVIGRKEALLIINEIVSELSPKRKSTCERHYLKHMTITEIAEQDHVSPEAIFDRLKESRKQIVNHPRLANIR